MKRVITICILAGLIPIVTTQVSFAATEVQKQTAINAGLEWLAEHQEVDGKWVYPLMSDSHCAATSAAVWAFVHKGYAAGSDVVIDGTNYGDVVGNGLNYIFSTAVPYSIGMQSAGDPDTNGNGIGVNFGGSGNSRMNFNTSFAVLAITATGTPAQVITTGSQAGRTYLDVVQDAVDLFAFGQYDSGAYRGGWRFTPNSGAGNENSPWVCFALMAAEDMGATVPAFVKSELTYWLNYIQYISLGHPLDGSSGFTSPTSLNSESKTGGLLGEMLCAGIDVAGGGSQYDLNHPRLLAALGYLDRQWTTDAYSCWYGNCSNPYAMWSIYAGLQMTVGLDDTTYITNLRGSGTLDSGDTPNWYEDYCEYLVQNQYADGSWDDDNYGCNYYTGALTTAWYVDILTAQTVQTISGYVHKAEGGGLEDVLVSADNDGGSDTTDENGYYELEVPDGWSGTVTPTKAGYSYDPVSRQYNNVTTDQTNQDFTATIFTYTISGSAGIDGVTMVGLPGSPVTSGGGLYSATVDYGWSGTVTPTKAGYTFSPTQRVYSNVTSDQLNQDYTPTLNTYTISGTVTCDGSGLDGVTMNGLPGNPVTSGGGIYSAMVPHGWDGTVTPTKVGWGFDPADREYIDVASNQSDQNFTAYVTLVTPTQTEKQAAIEAGLEWLAQNQQADGRWLYDNVGNDYYDTAVTGVVLEAFLEAGYRAGSDVILNHVNYGDVVGQGLDYVFSRASQTAISLQSAGDPDTNGNGIGVFFGPATHSVYNTSMVTSALIATGTPDEVISTGPLAGLTYRDAIQDAIDYLAWGQNDSSWPRGGWRFTANQGSSGNENSPWPCIAMVDAEQKMGGVIVVPQFVKDELDYWIAYIQYRNPGYPLDGSSGFTNPTQLNSESKTGGLLVEMMLAGDNVGDERVQAALGYLDREWPKDAYSTWYGNFGNPYAMIQIQKGLAMTVGMDDTTTITNFRDADKIDPCETWTWSKGYQRYLVDEQLPDGSWADYSNSFYEGPLATAWGVSILSGATEYTAYDKIVLDFEDVAAGGTGFVWMPPWTPYHDIDSMGANFSAYEVGAESWAKSMNDANGNTGSWSLVNWGGGYSTRSIVFDEEIHFHGAWFTWGQTDYLGNWVAAKWVQIVGKDKDGGVVGTTEQLTLNDTYQYLQADMEDVKTLEIISFNDEYDTSYYQMDNLEYSTVSPGQIVAWGDNTYGQCDVPEGDDFVAISSGIYHNLALKSDGSLVAWGWDYQGQCSDTPAGEDFVAISAGSLHNLVLRSDGSLAAWGNNSYGECNVPGGNDFVAIAAGTYHNVALKSDGSLVAWGYNEVGQCDVPEGNDFVDIGAGYTYSAALKSDGTLLGWGVIDPYTNPVAIDVADVSGGAAQCMARKFDRSLVVLSDDSYGQSSNTPEGNDFVAMGNGWLHCLAVRSDGSLEAWGYNENGECNVPGHDSFSAVAGGYFHSIALIGAAPDPPSIYLLDPNGGETLISSETHTIKWGSFGDVDNVTIEYSTDNGDSWAEVDPPNTGNTGSYSWPVPEITSQQCIVRISDPDHPEVFADASEVFGIYAVGAPEDLYICWYGSNKVVQYDDATGIMVGEFVPSVPGPYDVEFGPNGNLFVASWGGDCVFEYDGTTGELVGTFVASGDGGLDGIRDMAFGPNGNLFVLSKNNKNVIEYDGNTGLFVRLLTLDEANDPRAIAFSPSGNLFVASFRGHCVLEYDGSSGEFIRTVVSGAMVRYPSDLEFGPDDNLYIASWSNRSVLRYDDSTGGLTTFIPTASGGLSCPEEIGFGPDGALYVADWYNHEIKRYDGLDGSYIDTFASGDGILGYPSGLAFKYTETSSFQDMGTLEGGEYSEAGGVSADGMIVIGMSDSTSGEKAFRWTEFSGMQSLSDIPDSIASDVSDNGSVVVGSLESRAFRWTDTGGIEYLTDEGGSASGVSADGSVVVGYMPSNSKQAFRWTKTGGKVGLGDLPGGDSDSEATDVSSDGSVVVGRGRSESGDEAFVWDAGNGMVGIGDLPGGGFHSKAHAISGDGKTVVGMSESADGNEAFRWTADGGMTGLGDLPGGDFYSKAYAVSADGNTVVGMSKSDLGEEAFIWNKHHGMRRIKDVFEEMICCPALKVIDWHFISAKAISKDGLTIAGHGFNPYGHKRCWRFRIRVCIPPCKSDLNKNCDVDFYDFALLSSTWLSSPGDDNWNPAYDISDPKDGAIDELDLSVFCENWLWEPSTWSKPWPW